ncbi:TolC family protein [Campylobacter rectus]|uniref:Type I secretion system, outer membrane protein, TolC family n=1 Tax=Campylobacter rectus TaxID=203 RepID=A0A6G5QKC1_CAMRE|nr:TolC family protein [Campylobacter rectus]QCD46173.1 type I secretion system, outer membrane protein, TolC family [Campylobacter rectus]UEB46887.1 TolC family protein [Campylobacter rectus]
MFFIVYLFGVSLSAKSISFSSLSKSLESTNPSILSSKLQTLLANEEINAAKSSLYPRLSLNANSEYSKKYANTRNNYINDESLVGSTGFASSVSLKLNYELYKFGANALNIDAAAYKKQSLSYKECVVISEAKLRLLELYYNLLDSKDKLNSYNNLKQINKEIYEISKRLYENGDHTKTAMTNSAIRLVEIEDNIASLNKQIKNLLSEISNLSGEDIYIDDEIMPFSSEDMGGKFDQTSVSLNRANQTNQASQTNQTKSLKQALGFSPQTLSLDSLISSPLPPFEQTSEAKELNALILSKQSALESKKKEYYPAFYLYAKYDFYGDDKDSFRRSWGDTQRNGYRIGLSMVYNLFDGFNREASIKSASLELLLAKEQFNEAKRRYEKEARNINDDLHSNLEKLKTTSELTSYSKELLGMQERLNLNSQSDKLSVLESKVKFNENLIKNEEALLQANMLTVKRFLINEKSVDCKAL